MSELYKKLIEYTNSNAYPFHMPGHKRQILSEAYNDDSILSGALSIDITEITNFDNLYEATDLLKVAQDRVSSLYGSQKSYFLVNGSTSGILTSISAVSKGKDTIIVGRNCHKSVFNASYINKLRIAFVYPSYDNEYGINGEISAEELKKQIDFLISEGRKIAAVLITSPTYDGISSNIRDLSVVAHEKDIPLIVDQAHGAHFGFDERMPEGAVKKADLVIHSVHKTLPAPTQTALLHINSNLISEEQLEKFYGIFQTSSPSYILMAGIDRCFDLLEENREKLFDNLVNLRSRLEEKTKALKYISICPYTEPGKLVISVKDTPVSGLWLFNKLRDEYELEFEMAASTYVLGILTIMDTSEGVDRLADALINIDREISLLDTSSKDKLTGKSAFDVAIELPRSITVLDYYEACDLDMEEIFLEEALGRISGAFINLYPPGTPIVLPGEKLSEEILRIIKEYLNKGYIIQGIANNKIKVISNGEVSLSDG